MACGAPNTDIDLRADNSVPTSLEEGVIQFSQLQFESAIEGEGAVVHNLWAIRCVGVACYMGRKGSLMKAVSRHAWQLNFRNNPSSHARLIYSGALRRDPV